MDRLIYEYVLRFKSLNNGKKPDNLFDSLNDVLAYLYNKDMVDRKIDFFEESKILFLSEYQCEPENKIIKICFKSAQYDVRRYVINTDIIEDKGILKKREDGDLEKTHIAIKFLHNTAICLYEKNVNGIGFTKIMLYINKLIREFYKDTQLGIKYKIEHEAVVSRDFLNSLDKLNRVTEISLTVDKTNVDVSDAKDISGRADISESVDIVYKPAKKGILKDTVKQFYKMYNSSDSIVKRVTVKGTGQENKSKLSFNTEQMKEKMRIKVQTDFITGEVNTNSIFEVFSNKLEEV